MLDCYITSSWDTTLRLWRRPPTPSAAEAAGATPGTGAAAVANRAMSASLGSGADAAYLLPEDSDEAGNFVSEYEKAHPLITPKALSQVRSAMGCHCYIVP